MAIKLNPLAKLSEIMRVSRPHPTRTDAKNPETGRRHVQRPNRGLGRRVRVPHRRRIRELCGKRYLRFHRRNKFPICRMGAYGNIWGRKSWKTSRQTRVETKTGEFLAQKLRLNSWALKPRTTTEHHFLPLNMKRYWRLSH